MKNPLLAIEGKTSSNIGWLQHYILRRSDISSSPLRMLEKLYVLNLDGCNDTISEKSLSILVKHCKYLRNLSLQGCHVTLECLKVCLRNTHILFS